MQLRLPHRQDAARYDALSYSQWKHLPPNLPLPTSTSVSVFEIHFSSILYLHQISQQGTYELKIEWWGLARPHHVVFAKEQGATAKYIVCCPLEGLLSYLSDMKVVVVDVVCKNKTIGRGYLNFLVLKGWRGEHYQGYMDIREGKKKIGEITFSIRIDSVPNPYLYPQLSSDRPITPKDVSANNLQMTQRRSNGIKQNDQKQDRASPRQTKKISAKQSELQYQEQLNSGDRVQSVAESEILQDLDVDRHYRQVKRKTDRVVNNWQLQLEPHRDRLNYEAELVRLAEDYNILFSKRQGNLFENRGDHLIEIQIVGLDLPATKQPHQQVLITLPLPSQNRNEYRVGVGAFIKLCLSQQTNRQQVINYLKTTDVQFRTTAGLEGVIKLSKILANCGQVIQVPLSHKDKKQKIKGACFIKAVPPPERLKEQPRTSAEQTGKPQPSAQQSRSQAADPIKQFVLLSFKRYNSVQSFYRKVNLYVKISEAITLLPLGESKTLWNCQSPIQFDDRVTCQTNSEILMLELFDRQGSDVRLGEGQLLMQTPIGIGLQVPIICKERGRQRNIGFLSIDFVRNGLNSVTKMIDIFGRTGKDIVRMDKGQQKQADKSKSQSIEKQQQSQSDIEEYEHQQGELNVDDTSKEQIRQTEIITTQKKHKPIAFDRSLTELQIYNKLFTFLYQNTAVLSKLSEPATLKITYFLQVMQPLLQKQILSVKQLNLIISKHITSAPGTLTLNQIDLAKLRDSYDAFSTYFEQLTEGRDHLLKELLQIIDNAGISINDLEYSLKNARSIWQTIHNICSDANSSAINLVQELRGHYQFSRKSSGKVAMAGAQFCDILRRFEVYQTSLGDEIQQSKFTGFIYQHICELLVSNDPDAVTYSIRELIQCLRQQEIELSAWETLNLEEYMKQEQGRNLNKRENHIPQPDKAQIYQMTEPFRQQNIGSLTNKPTITKSPTFGHLHAPEVFKKQEQLQQPHMVESLDIRMHNLPISPINYQSSQSPTQGLRVCFSHLRFQLNQLHIDGRLIDLTKVKLYYPEGRDETQNRNNLGSQDKSIKNYESGNQNASQNERYYAEDKSYLSNSIPARREISSLDRASPEENIEISLSEVIKKFSYEVQLYFLEQPGPIALDCVHDEWCSIVSDEGEYLGSVLIG